MLVSNIIANGMLKADVPSTAFYTAAEGLVDAQAAWIETYAFLIENNDNFYATELYIPFASFTADANRTSMYIYTLPVDYSRLRVLQYGNTAGINNWFPCYKMTTEDYGRTQNAPAYMIIAKDLHLYDPMHYPTYYMLYYPLAATLTAASDISYPNDLINNIMIYQVAIAIRIKQKLPTEEYKAMRDEYKAALLHLLPRDDFKAEKPKNEFNQGFNQYI